MNININEYIFNALIELYKKSNIEISGRLKGVKNENNFYVTDVKLDDMDDIKSASDKEIVFSKNYFAKKLYDLAHHEGSEYVMFHTHPTSKIGSLALSEADEKMIKFIQTFPEKVGRKITIIEGVITRGEIAFYFYDDNVDKIERLPLFVNGKEYIPLREQNIKSVFKTGFQRGRERSKNKSKRAR